MPVMPHRAAGWRIEPPVSVPVAMGTMRAATAAAEPPEEPPGTLLVFQGLRVGPKWEFSLDEPMANSSMLVLPTITVPAALSRLDHVGVVGADEVGEHLRAAGGQHAFGAEDVLVGQRECR
jgi:hypothetical protein